jgi:Fe-S cluster assembly ATP-binding protein
MSSPLLTIRDLHVAVDGQNVLRGLNLQMAAGQVHALMGPNGSGKSTLAQVIAGRDAYAITAGEIRYAERDLLAMAPEERARAGVFVGFQYPAEVPGVSTLYFLRTALNAIRRARGQEQVDAFDFLELAREKARIVELDDALLKRSVNHGFSGGEKKRCEIFQMAVLEPRLAILDEPDSGLDLDALRSVAAAINRLRSPDRAMLLITHYQRLLEYVVPDQVHILKGGCIVASGDASLALRLERGGYDTWTQPCDAI